MREIEIKTIQDFISSIENLGTDFFYRGEPSLTYEAIIASSFRDFPVPFSKKVKKIDYRQILQEYYEEIGHELNSIERENFMQYAQHHGIPTPLVDITSSPLIALHFACSSNYDENKCKVHAFNKNQFIDMSDFDLQHDMNLMISFLIILLLVAFYHRFVHYQRMNK